MLRRPALRPALEPLEPRQLMATDLPQLWRPADDQRVAGPAEFGKSRVDYTAPPSAGEVTYPEWNAVTGNVIGDLYYNYSNMTAEVVDGVLKIRGDFGNNSFRMLGGGGTYRIEPSLTKVNGQVWTYESGPFSFTGVTSGIDIDLGAGDDDFTLEIADAPDITIRTGAGNDKVSLRGPDNSRWRAPDYGPGLVVGNAIFPVHTEAIPLAIAGDVLIDTGAGNDWISGYARASGDVTVRMGDGDDSFVEGPLEREYWRPITSRAITADGLRTVDLGAGQDVENIPDDIDYDFELTSKMSWVYPFFSYYRHAVDQGEITAGQPQLVRYVPYANPVRIDGEGRVEVEILFTPGVRRVIDRLIARGVMIDAYTVLGGGARALISEQDLRLFANLPGLIRVQPVTYVRDEPRPVTFRWELPWDYIRPGSVPEEEELRWGPRPPAIVEQPPSSGPSQILLPLPMRPFSGPMPIDRLPVLDVDPAFPDIKQSFYGRQIAFLSMLDPIYGPHELE